jgi:hypothetical protein
MLSEPHRQTLQRVADLLADARDPWWVLGSAAMALIGIDPGEIHDIDVLVSAPDAEALMHAFALTNQADGGTTHFRSDYFLIPPLGEIRVEIMAGYHILSEAAWTPVCPATRQAIAVGPATVFVPERQDQINLLTRLGRPKDHARLRAFT